MNYRVGLAAIAAAGLVVSAMSTSALARGGGGFGGRAGFVSHSTTTHRTTTVTRSGSIVTTRTTATTTTKTARVTATNRAVTLIRPQVISVPATFATASTLPSLAGVAVAPLFGPTAVAGLPYRMPNVATPYGVWPGFGYTGFGDTGWLQPEVATVAVQPEVAAPVAAASRSEAPAPSPVAPASPLSSCQLFPNGYHCDWPS